MAIENKFVLRVVVIPVSRWRSTVADLFPLILNLTYAGFAPTANVVGDLYKLENVLLQIVSCYRKARKGSTYVAQIFHDIEEVIRLLVVVVHRIDSLFEH